MSTFALVTVQKPNKKPVQLRYNADEFDYDLREDGSLGTFYIQPVFRHHFKAGFLTQATCENPQEITIFKDAHLLVHVDFTKYDNWRETPVKD